MRHLSRWCRDMANLHMTTEQTEFDPQIVVLVKDADGYLVEDALIEWTKNGLPYGRIDHSYGRGTLTIKDRDARFGVSVTYGDKAMTRILAIDQKECIIVFNDLHTRPSWRIILEKHFPAVVGILLLLLAVFLAFYFGNANVLQTRVILAIIALGGGAFAAEIQGILNVNINLGAKLVISAAGAAAVFVILYLVVPAT